MKSVSNIKYSQVFMHRRYDKSFFCQMQDLPTMIKKTAAFLDKILTNDQVEALAQHLSFNSMKSNPAVNYEEHIILNKQMKLINVDGEFIRSGKVDQWKEEMPGIVIEEFDKMTKEKFSTQNLFF